MLFNSWEFVCLVIVTLSIYYLPFMKRWQTYVLLLASILFYVYDSWRLLILLFASGIVNAITSYGAKYMKHPRFYATIGVLVNLCLLGLFKYGNLLSETFIDCNNDLGKILFTIPLPLGISFYTFSGISLVIDAYKGRYNSTKIVKCVSFIQHLKNTLLYICFFPKLLAGPIAKSNDFFNQIKPKAFHNIDWHFIFKSLIIGYFLKMVIADNLKDYTFWMAFPYFEHRGTGTLLLMLFGYSIQMYADFAGYSLIAIGVAALFGYHLPKNFNFPYISASFREFWKRWHITLSQFLMEYLYFFLGGNRKGKVKTYINLLLTMMLGGLWHGAAWSYLVWGTYHGLCLVVERLLCGRRTNCIQIGRGNFSTIISHYLSITLVFVFVSFGWLLFKLPHFNEVILYLKCIVNNYTSISSILRELFFSKYIPAYATPILLYHFIYCYKDHVWMQRYILKYDFIIYGIMLFLIITNSGSVSSFVYFQF